MLAFLLSLSLSASVSAIAQDREVEVRQATARFLKAFNDLDWTAFKACWEYKSDTFAATVVFPPLSPSVLPEVPVRRVTGREAEGVWRRLFDGIRRNSGRTAAPYQDIQPQDELIEMLGDGVAIVMFHLGNEKRVSRRTLVWKRTSDGWKIVHLHASAIEVSK